jgi:predicted PurR-regulated permease PerM
VLLAIISTHTYEGIVSRTGARPALAATAMGAIYLISLIVPLLFLVTEAMTYAPALAGLPEKLSSGELMREIEASEAAVLKDSVLGTWFALLDSHLDQLFSQIAPHLGGVAAWFLAKFSDLGIFLFEFLLGCATAIFLLHHRSAARSAIARLLQGIGGQFAVELMQQTVDTTRGTFQGVIFAAIAQAALSAIALFLAGVPGAMALTTLAFLLALVQIGPVVVGAIAAGILGAQGETFAAILMFLWFLVVIASVDNLIRPHFAARSTDMPGYLAFIGGLSGVLSFGFIGVFIGPVLVTLLFRIAQSWIGPASLR